MRIRIRKRGSREGSELPEELAESGTGPSTSTAETKTVAAELESPKQELNFLIERKQCELVLQVISAEEKCADEEMKSCCD